MATGNLFKRAAAYRKKHKGLTQVEAVQAVAKMGKATKRVSAGPVKRKEAGTKKRTTRRKRIGELPVAVANSLAGISRKSCAISGIAKTKKLLNQIESLEQQRKRAKKKELKDIIQLEINARHDKIDHVRYSYRK